MPPGAARRRALAAGLAVAVAYLALAAISGRLSPLARRPLLDGTAPVAPYRWVSPPPELAATNVPPTAGDFTLPLTDHGSRPDVLTTDDAQVTIILQAGTFAPAPGQTDVRLTVTPTDPATIGSPDGLAIIGNAYLLEATYEPGGDAILEHLQEPLEVILVYPLTPDAHTTARSVVSSADGQTWNVSEGTDSLAIQQAEGPVDTPGYVAVGARQTPVEFPSTPEEGSNSTLGIALIVLAVCAALVGVGLLLRGRDPTRQPAKRRR
jgi:hypothetical protein